MDKEIGELKHGVETIGAAQSAVCDEINKIADAIPRFRKLLNLFDTNKDGRVSFKELLNPELLKMLLVFVITCFIIPLLDIIQAFLTHVPSTSGNLLFELFKFIIGPVIFVFYFRYLLNKIMSVNDLKEKTKDGIIVEKDCTIKNLEDKYRKLENERMTEKAAMRIKEVQIEGALEAKNREIEYIKKGYKLDDLNKPDKIQ